MDEIVLNYCVSILEELGENQDHDDFDVEGFCEMMQAFVEEFSTIPQVEVATWMFELEARLRELRNQGIVHQAKPLAIHNGILSLVL